jgi:hypothetical protein
MTNGKFNKAGLIREFFGLSGTEAIAQIKALPEPDRLQLGSAIAREKGLNPADLDFELCAY